MKTTGERIKDIRLELGETLEEFGDRFDTSKVTVFNWEKGRNLPNKSNLKKIAEIGETSVNELLSPYSVGERIKDIRLEKGMSKTEFGKLFETTGSLVNKWETNQVTPTEKRLKEIADIGGVSIHELTYRKPIGKKIRNIRKSLGYSQLEFSKVVGVTKSAVANWENGYNHPNNDRLKVIAGLGNTTVNQLLNSNPLSDYSTDELLQELECRGISHETTNE